MKTFKNDNVCGLRRANVISLCREFSQHKYSAKSYRIFLEGYDETVCRRRMVFYAKSPQLDSADGFSMAVLKCPPMYKIEDDRKILLVYVSYLSMGLKPRSFMWYHRPNLTGREIRLISLIYKPNFNNFEEDERRIREFMEPGYIAELQRRVFGKPSPAYLTWSPQNGSLQLILDRNIVEDSTINFMKVKLMKKREYREDHFLVYI